MIVAISIVVLLSFSVSQLVGLAQTDGPRSGNGLAAETQAIDPLTFTIQMSPATGASVGQEVTFFINATSNVTDATITVRVYYDARLVTYANNTASPYGVNVTGNPARVVQKYTYTAPGNWTDLATGRHYVFIRAYIQDNASTTINKQFNPYFVNYNVAPEIVSLTPQISATPGVPQAINLTAKDLDNDTLTVAWDFGDGTSQVDILYSTLNGVYLNITHTWNPPITPGIGDYYVNYTVNLTIQDGWDHWTNGTIPVNIYFPPNRPPLDTVLTVPPGTWEPMQPIPFTASAREVEGEAMYWYWNFGDGTTLLDVTPVTTANITVWDNQTHAFELLSGDNATYNVTLFVSDGVEEHNMSAGSVTITILENHAPGFYNISYYPETLEINATIGYLNMTFWIEAVDDDGDNITATWYMDDGSAPRVNVSEGGTGVYTFYQWRNFTQACQFNITVVVSDGREGHNVSRYLNATMLSTNSPPMLTRAPSWTYASGDAARPNETLNFTLKVADQEFDAITIVWDFGDNSSIIVLHFNRTDYVGGSITCSVEHTYSKVGTYQISIWITDNQLGFGNHNVSVNATVVVKLEQKQVVIVWDWWDYTSLGLFLMIPASIAIYSIWVLRRRRRLDKEGIAWDEYKAKKDSGFEEEL